MQRGLQKEQGSGRSRRQPDLGSLTGLLETLLANTPTGVAVFDLEQRFICVNEAFATLSGFAPEQHLGRTTAHLLPQMTAVDTVLKTVLRTNQPVVDVEMELQREGVPRHLLGGFYPIRGGTGETLAVAEMVVDITERKRAEIALQVSEDRQCLATESANLGTWDLDLIANKLNWSDRARAMASVGPDVEVTYELFLSLVHPDDIDKIMDVLAKAKDPAGGGDYRIEYRCIGLSDRVERWLDLRGKVYFDESRRPVRFAGMVSDISGRRKHEESLRLIAEQLSQSNQSLATFAHLVSHDMKEPLRTISSFASLLAAKYSGRLDSAADTYLRFVVEGARRMGQLIDDMLVYAEAGRKRRPFTPVDCTKTLQNVIQSLGILIAESKADITYDALPTVLGDEPQIEQLFQNLLQNAIKYRRKDVPPRIHLGVERKDREWAFSVRDNGMGIRADKLDQIFMPLFRLHSQSDIPGSGLGLATCRKNVDGHGGRIWVESAPGLGSTFFFTLPAGAEG